jgi:hypothetical protein
VNNLGYLIARAFDHAQDKKTKFGEISMRVCSNAMIS